MSLLSPVTNFAHGVTAVTSRELRGRMRGRRAFVILTNYLSTPPTGVPPSTARRLKSQSGTLRNLTTQTADAVWKLGWACTSGDVCQ